MKSRQFALSVLCLSLTLADLACAQTAVPSSTSPALGAPGRARFEAIKQRRIQELSALLSCVQAATNREELHACHRHHGRATGTPAPQ